MAPKYSAVRLALTTNGRPWRRPFANACAGDYGSRGFPLLASIFGGRLAGALALGEGCDGALGAVCVPDNVPTDPLRGV